MKLSLALIPERSFKGYYNYSIVIANKTLSIYMNISPLGVANIIRDRHRRNEVHETLHKWIGMFCYQLAAITVMLTHTAGGLVLYIDAYMANSNQLNKMFLCFE